MEQTDINSSLMMKNSEEQKPGMSQVYAEVYQVIFHMENALQILIPRKFIQFLHENMDAKWGCNLDFSNNINDMDLLQETRVLLSLVYRDFICTPEERTELIKKEKREAILGGWEYESSSLLDLF